LAERFLESSLELIENILTAIRAVVLLHELSNMGLSLLLSERHLDLLASMSLFDDVAP
jgi:hypothetical protein